MENSWRALEVTVISGEELFVSKRRPVMKNAFVIIRTDSCYQGQRTRMDKDGGSYPAWDEKLVIDMPMHARDITVEVQCNINGFDRIIGAARIPVSDFMGGYVPQDYLHFLSYRLRDSNGERNGIINLSIRVKGTFQAASCAASSNSSKPWTRGVPVDVGKASYGMVTGVPVSLYNNYSKCQA